MRVCVSGVGEAGGCTPLNRGGGACGRGVELCARVIGGAQAHLHIGTETPPR